MTVKELKELLERFDDETEVVLTGSWTYSKTVPGSVKSFEGPLKLVIDALEMNNRVELCGKFEDVDPWERRKTKKFDNPSHHE